MCCTRLAGNTGRKMTQKIANCASSQTLSSYIFATKACIDNRKNLLSSNMCSRCPHNMVNFGPLTAEIGWRVLGHPSKFQGVSRLGFVTAATSLIACQPNFARCLAVSWAGTLYIFVGSCPLTEFRNVQNSLCVQVLHSPTLAASLHARGNRENCIFPQMLY